MGCVSVCWQNTCICASSTISWTKPSSTSFQAVATEKVRHNSYFGYTHQYLDRMCKHKTLMLKNYERLNDGWMNGFWWVGWCVDEHDSLFTPAVDYIKCFSYSVSVAPWLIQLNEHEKKRVTNAFLLAGCCVGHTTSQTIIHCYAYRNTNHRVVQKNSCKLKKEMEETTQQDSSEAARLPLTCMGSWKQSAHVYTSRKNCLYGSSSSSSNTPVDSQQNCWFTTGQRLAPIRYMVSQNDVLSPLINGM